MNIHYYKKVLTSISLIVGKKGCLEVFFGVHFFLSSKQPVISNNVKQLFYLK